MLPVPWGCPQCFSVLSGRVPQLPVLQQPTGGAGPGTAGDSTVSNSVPTQAILTQPDMGEEFSCGPRDLCLRLALGKRSHWPVCPNSWLCLSVPCVVQVMEHPCCESYLFL